MEPDRPKKELVLFATSGRTSSFYRRGMFSIAGEGWRRAGFELGIVFLGVLIALFVDGWNEGRVEHGIERDYLERISADVGEDLLGPAALATALDGKREAIGLLLSDAPMVERQTGEEILVALVQATSAGFGVLSGNSTTFEDLRGTGNLGLVSDPDLRSEIVAYYESWRFNAARVEARRTTLPADIYALLPPGGYSTDVFFDAPSDSVPTDFSRSRVVGHVKSEPGRSSLRAEANYARFFRGVVRDLKEQADGLGNAIMEAR